jgi:hypothetical protein
MDNDTTTMTTPEADCSTSSDPERPVSSRSSQPLATDDCGMDNDTTTMTTPEADCSTSSDPERHVSSPSSSYEKDGVSILEARYGGTDRDEILRDLVDCAGVKIINICSHDMEGKQESCFLLSAVLTIVLHSIRLLRYVDEAYMHDDNKYHIHVRRVLERNIRKWGIVDAWSYEEVLESLSLLPKDFPHQMFSTSSFDFGYCVKSFLTPDCLKRNGGLRCIGTIDLLSCVDYKSLQSNLQSLYQKSEEDEKDSDKSLVFVNVQSRAGNQLNSVPYTVILNSKRTNECLQLTAALYISYSGTLKVVLVTRSIYPSFLGSNYFMFDFDIPNSPTAAEKGFPLIASDVLQQPTSSSIFTSLPGGYQLSGLVFMKSLSQLQTAIENAYVLSPELYRRNKFTLYGRDEKIILASATRWLSGQILNSVFGIVSELMNEQADKGGIQHTALSTMFLHEVLRDPNPVTLQGYAPDFDFHDATLNKVIHIPVNYPKDSHWLYIFLQVNKTRTIFLMDSCHSIGLANKELFANKLNEYFEADFKIRQASKVGRKKHFLKWDMKVINSPQQDDSNNCGIFTIMNMVRICETLKHGGYVTSTATDKKVASTVLVKLRYILSEILFQNQPVINLLNFVNKFPSFK